MNPDAIPTQNPSPKPIFVLSQQEGPCWPYAWEGIGIISLKLEFDLRRHKSVTSALKQKRWRLPLNRSLSSNQFRCSLWIDKIQNSQGSIGWRSTHKGDKRGKNKESSPSIRRGWRKCSFVLLHHMVSFPSHHLDQNKDSAAKFGWKRGRILNGEKRRRRKGGFYILIF